MNNSDESQYGNVDTSGEVNIAVGNNTEINMDNLAQENVLEPNNESNTNNEIPVYNETQPNSTGSGFGIGDRTYLEDQLVPEYIGKNSDKILTKKVSIPPFFFGGLYFFYRKMYSFGVLYFVLSWIALKLELSVYMILVNIVLMFTFNSIYKKVVKRRVKTIVHSNPDKEFAALQLICQAKGGTTKLGIIGGLLLDILVFAAIYITLVLSGVYNTSDGILKNMFNYGKNAYEGVLALSDPTGLTFSFPEGFIKKDNYSAYVEMPLNNDVDGGTKCTFNINRVLLYTNAEKLANQMSKYHKAENPKKENINGVKWYVLSFESEFGNNNIYLTTYKNQVYQLEYIVEQNANKVSCDPSISSVINSIKFK